MISAGRGSIAARSQRARAGAGLGHRHAELLKHRGHQVAAVHVIVDDQDAPGRPVGRVATAAPGDEAAFRRDGVPPTGPARHVWADCTGVGPRGQAPRLTYVLNRRRITPRTVRSGTRRQHAPQLGTRAQPAQDPRGQMAAVAALVDHFVEAARFGGAAIG